MSSFIINKREYIKAAGLMYGVAESRRFPHKYFLSNIRKNFAEVYGMNVSSVNKQYNDNTPEDVAEYDDVFEEYRSIGRRVYNGECKLSLDNLRKKLLRFFSSVLYQIEDEEMNEKAGALFFACTEKLFPEIYNTYGDWGEIEI